MIDNRILIFEYMEKYTDLIKNTLRNIGLEVKREILTEVEDINNKVVSLEPNIIILNSFEDDDSLIKVIKNIKEDNRTKGIPIFVIIHGLNNNCKNQLIDLDVEDYIEFPFDVNEFIHKIMKLIKAGRLQKKLTLSKKALEESLFTIEQQKRELDKNLSLAGKIQEALIPKSIGNIPNCSFEWRFKPSGKVGGDIFDVFMLDENHMGLYMIDVMGHGVASSMLAVALSEFLITDVDRGSPLKRKIATPPYYEILSPLQVVEYLNKRFPFSKYNHYFTIFYMVMNVKTGVLKYIRAAHPAPILVKNNGSITELDAYGTPVGFEFKEGYEEKTVYLDPGDNLIIYTDGLYEIEDDDGVTLKHQDVLKYLATELDNNSNLLTANLNKWIGSKKIKDDLTVLEMKWVKFI